MSYDYEIYSIGTPVQGNLPPAPPWPPLTEQAALASGEMSAEFTLTAPGTAYLFSDEDMRVDIRPASQAGQPMVEGRRAALRAGVARWWELPEPGTYVIVCSNDFTPPEITSGATFNVAGGSVLDVELTADEEAVFEIVGGDDRDQFEIVDNHLVFTGDGTRDDLDPQDADTDNDYEVTVRATDLAGNHSDPLEMTITVQAP
jgi:hypothetical protein